jgi:ABC-type lipoprotein release transport system permease subunit
MCGALHGSGSLSRVGVAFAFARVVGSLLFQVSRYDSAIAPSDVGVLMALGTEACLLPARRAAAVEPMQALGRE